MATPPSCAAGRGAPWESPCETATPREVSFEDDLDDLDFGGLDELERKAVQGRQPHRMELPTSNAFSARESNGHISEFGSPLAVADTGYHQPPPTDEGAQHSFPVVSAANAPTPDTKWNGNFESLRREDFSRKNFFPWETDMRFMMQHQFGLQSFRPNQREVVNCTLAGRDVFVLMPTGGGKSLCYQLPSVLSPGLTVVISPLISLIEDQVAAAQEHGIQAAFLTGGIDATLRKEIYAELNRRDTIALRLLYVTPELLARSDGLKNSFARLANRGMLSRFVIDEAHCISGWGHDFRPDYRTLSNLRRDFDKVPVMALTATATMRVRADIVRQLGLRNHFTFQTSFNRPNLRYHVLPKKRALTKDIANIIEKNHSGQTGIIYCLSKRDCETVAQELKGLRIRAEYYHADLSANDRSLVQRKWTKDEIKVIVATIAFGMGIDKSDVRFVIHHSVPKSLEGYYQEAGRAGRDGEVADCYLFWTWQDRVRQLKMIEDAGSSGNLEEKRSTLNAICRYAEDRITCRRVLQLQYFDEQFDPEQCHGTCDNCSGEHEDEYAVEDATELAKVVIKIVEQMSAQNGLSTSNNVSSVLQGLQPTGKASRNVQLNAFAGYGAGKKPEFKCMIPSRDEGVRFIQNMVLQELLVEEIQQSRGGEFAFAVLRCNPRVAQQIQQGRLTFPFSVKQAKRKGSTSRAGGGGGAAPRGASSAVSSSRENVHPPPPPPPSQGMMSPARVQEPRGGKGRRAHNLDIEEEELAELDYVPSTASGRKTITRAGTPTGSVQALAKAQREQQAGRKGSGAQHPQERVKEKATEKKKESSGTSKGRRGPGGNRSRKSTAFDLLSDSGTEPESDMESDEEAHFSEQSLSAVDVEGVSPLSRGEAPEVKQVTKSVAKMPRSIISSLDSDEDDLEEFTGKTSLRIPGSQVGSSRAGRGSSSTTSTSSPLGAFGAMLNSRTAAQKTIRRQGKDTAVKSRLRVALEKMSQEKFGLRGGSLFKMEGWRKVDRNPPRNIKDVSKLDGMNDKFLEQRGMDVLRVVFEVMHEENPEEWPVWSEETQLEQQKRLGRLLEKSALEGQEKGIAAASIPPAFMSMRWEPSGTGADASGSPGTMEGASPLLLSTNSTPSPMTPLPMPPKRLHPIDLDEEMSPEGNEGGRESSRATRDTLSSSPVRKRNKTEG